MTAKRKRRRNRSSARGATKTAEPEVLDSEEAPPEQSTPPLMAQSPFPTLGLSLAHGLRLVGSSPPILAVAFLSLLATWGVFVAFGADPDPRGLAVLLPVPPAQVLGDAGVAIPRGDATWSTIAGVGSFAAVRALTYGLLCLLIVGALRGGAASVSGAVRALPRLALVFAGLYLAHFGLVLAGAQMLELLVPGVGRLVAIAAGLHFLGFSTVIAAAEGHAPGQAVRRGVRAARLPGTRHLTLVMAYYLLLVYSAAIAPFPILGPSTPGIAAWSYALVFTFVHVSVLAAIAYRWLLVRDQVPAVAPPRKR